MNFFCRVMFSERHMALMAVRDAFIKHFYFNAIDWRYKGKYDFKKLTGTLGQKCRDAKPDVKEE